MKIALLKSGLTCGGGLEKYARYTAQAFAKKGCEVYLLTTCRKKHTAPSADQPFETVILGKAPPLSVDHRIRFDLRCKHWLRQNPCDLIFGMDRNSWQTHYRAGDGVHREQLRRRCQSECLLKRLSFPLNPLHRSLLYFERKTFENPSLRRLFVNSSMVGNQILEHYRTDPSKIHVVHNGVEWEQFARPFSQWKQERPRTFEEFRLDPHRFQFLFLGHGFRRKGLTPLLHALTQLPTEAFQLSVVGRDKEIGRYKKMIEELGLQNSVHIWGPRFDVVKFFQVADALVIPSLYDPFANVTVEALAMGLPVLSSENNGGKEVLNSELGAIFPLEIDAIAHTLKKALAKPKTAKSALSIRNAVAHLDFSNQLSQIVDLTLSDAC